MEKRPFFVFFRQKNAFHVLWYISKTKVAQEKLITYLESRENYLSGCCHRFFTQTSSSASKIHLKSDNLSKITGRRPNIWEVRPTGERELVFLQACVNK